MADGAKVVHHIPGRLRVRLPRSQRDPRILRELHEFVSGLGGVRSVEINPVTGSILVHYHPESPEEVHRLIERYRDSGESLETVPPELTDVDDIADKIEREAEFLSAHSELAMQVVTAVKALNRGIRDATGNTVDLKVLLPAGLAVWAFLKAGADVATPLWITLAIFSFNSFVSLHHPVHSPPVSHTTIIGG